MKYQSELIKEIIDSRGHEKSSLHYESECVESWIEEVKGGYPKLCDYQSEWLNYINENSGIGNFPYLTLVDVTDAVVENVVPYAYKSAILKGSTKYRDIDTGDFLETFEDGRNLELVSVKMPVLTTTGNNLLDPNYLKEQCLKISSSATYTDGNIVFNSNAFHGKRLIALDFEPNTQYAFNLKMSGQPNAQLHITAYYTDSPTSFYSHYIGDWTDTISGITKANATVDYITISYGNGVAGCVLYVDECSLFKSDTVMPHEPFKSNILTVNEEVELRGIGDVKDTLDCLTGEVTERVGEIVFDGTEDWYSSMNNDGGYRFDHTIPTMHQYPTYGGNPVGEMLSNYLPVGGFTISKTYDKLITTWENRIVLYLGMDITTTKELKEYLSQNPLTVQYRLATESIKTVDLTIIDQDGNTLSKIKPIEGTMVISTDGTPLKPLLSAEIPVEATTQNLSSFIDLEME